MKPAKRTTISREITGPPHSWKVRVLRKLTKKQRAGLQQLLILFDGVTADDKEALVDGIELRMHDVYDYQMYIFKAGSEKLRVSIRVVQIPDADQIAASNVTEVEHGIH